jgi:2-polyprenyl-6-methoxyphenol hydroxylase-like FAD-dependent oxidoreductase
MSSDRLHTTCCIVGGGPAGMMLGFLLARAGVSVTVLEKHKDFLRDFRGDTIHPSTLEIMGELGLLQEFLRLPHQEARSIGAKIGEQDVTPADFSHLPTRCKFVVLMPQWDFLDFLARQGARYPGFDLRMEHEAVDLIRQGGRIAGVKVCTPADELEIAAGLVVAADGRHSTLRHQAGLELIELGAPMDVLWMRLSRRPDDPKQVLGRFDVGGAVVLIDRGDYWQCGLVIPKGGIEAVRQRGLGGLRADLIAFAPFLGDRTKEIDDWSRINLLSVQVNRLKRWHLPGLLCIGDAAHAMSPVGGVGINLAIQDAVATANILAQSLRAGRVEESVLAKVQARRELPTRLTQGMQLAVQNWLFQRVLQTGRRPVPPLPVRLLQRWPWLRRFPARILGLGFRPEHVRTAEERPPR